MSHPALPIFRARALEFADPLVYPDAQIEYLMVQIELWISGKAYGNRLLEAIALITAHQLKMAENGADGVAGTSPLTGQRAGRVAVQYAQVTGRTDELDLTIYGKALKELRRSRPNMRPFSTSTFFTC